MDSVGSLYGTTRDGGLNGAGIVYKLEPGQSAGNSGTWSQTVLYNFCSQIYCDDGGGPYRSALIIDAAGNLYGISDDGGPRHDGAIFQLSPNQTAGGWVYRLLYTFCSEAWCLDGFLPRSGLTLDAAGNLYGTTFYGGTADGGVVYRLTRCPRETDGVSRRLRLTLG
jgi:uncharacterized repeat protein (TIGR03803 family)